MTWSYGFGLATYLQRYPTDYTISAIQELSRHAVMPEVFHERIDGRVARFARREVTWLADDDPLAVRIQTAYAEGAGSVPNVWDPFVEAECGLILPHYPDVDTGAWWGELQIGWPFDALPYTYAWFIDARARELADNPYRDPERQAWAQNLIEVWSIGCELKLIWSMYELVAENRSPRQREGIEKRPSSCATCRKPLSVDTILAAYEAFALGSEAEVPCDHCRGDVVGWMTDE